MDIYPGQRQLPHYSQGVALTIGNFDGVHMGHRQILHRLRQEADSRGLPTVLMTFEPQPAEYFARKLGKPLPYRLTPMRDKMALLNATSCLDAVWVSRFNSEFSQIPAVSFIENILLKQLNTKYMLIGDDFCFGKNRTGNFDLLGQYLAVDNINSVEIANRRASSTAVRQALANGDLPLAKRILGYDYRLSGRVMHGKKLGRKLGCPTANIYLPAHHYALSGVFVVQVSGCFGHRRGVASFGFNPTVSQNKKQKLEVHIFDLNENLYSERLTVHFLHKLRDEAQFANVDELRERIYADMDIARAWQAL